MVQLNVAVTDSKGNYVTGLRPWDFVISEDGIPQKLPPSEEGNEGPRRLADFAGKRRAQTGWNLPRKSPSRLQGGSRATVSSRGLLGLGSAVSRRQCFHPV